MLGEMNVVFCGMIGADSNGELIQKKLANCHLNVWLVFSFFLFCLFVYSFCEFEFEIERYNSAKYQYIEFNYYLSLV